MNKNPLGRGLSRSALTLLLLAAIVALMILVTEPSGASIILQQSGTASTTPSPDQEEAETTATSAPEQEVGQEETTPTPEVELNITTVPAPEETIVITPVEEGGDNGSPQAEETATARETAPAEETVPAEEVTPEDASMAEDDSYAAELWQQMQEDQYSESWSTIPGKGELYPGQAPHGALLTTYLNEVARQGFDAQSGEMPDGSIVVTENYNADETLASVTVMQKRAGYAPSYNDWYFASYGPDGEAQASSGIVSCMSCHAAVRSNDYIFGSVVAPVEDLSTLLTPTPGATGQPAGGAETEAARATATPTPTPEPMSDDELISTGNQIFSRVCAACHQADGEGIPDAYPALAGNAFVLTEDPAPVLRVIFTGRAGMPHFHGALSDREIAAVASYIRNAWDNDASVVSQEQVRTIEQEVYSPSEPMEHIGAGE